MRRASSLSKQSSLYTILLATVFHGSSLNPWVFALFRDILGGGCLMTAAIFHVRRRKNAGPTGTPAFWPRREDLGHFVALGFLCVWGQGLYAIAVSLTTSDFTTLLQPTQPVIAFVAAVALGLEPFLLGRWMSWAKAASVVVAVGGAAFVVVESMISANSDIDSSKNLPLGTVYILLQVGSGHWQLFMSTVLLHSLRSCRFLWAASTPCS
jgi:drug/metabolite transporter (DMT)-like permease